ncbi:MAG: glycosyltransferase family 4 protein, partial [Caldilineales bacterium]
VVVQLVQGLRRAGVEVHVVTFDFTKTQAEDTVQEADGVTVHRLRLRRLPRWTGVRINAGVLARRLRAIAPDIAHAHSGGTFADGALGSQVPAVITVHGVISQEAATARQSGIAWREDLAWRYEVWYERHCLRRARDVIAISPYVAHLYRELTGARMSLVENPVAQVYFDLPDQTEATTILCAARVIQRKNVLGLLHAFARLRQQLPEARLRLAGETTSEPAYAGQCRQFVAQGGLSDAVDFLGWLDEAALQAEYSRCRALALFSWQETAPVAIEQAMAAGKPVVASDVGGVRYLVNDGVTGFVVAPDDPSGQAAALHRVLSDSQLSTSMGQAARSAALARFHPDQVTEQTLAVYQQAIASQRTR